MLQRNQITWPLAAIISLGLAIISVGSAYTKNQRLSTIHASLVSVNTARDEFASWDLEHQRRLLQEAATREEALAKIGTYEDRRRVVEHSFELAYRALALAATQADEASMSAAVSSVRSLDESIGKLRSDHSTPPIKDSP